MNHHQKQPSMRLLAVAALLALAPMQGVLAWHKAPPALGSANAFAVLGGTAVTLTCPPGGVTGDVGVLDGTAAYTNTNCPVTGKVPPATNRAAVTASRDFLRAYDALILRSPCTTVDLNAVHTLNPGVYCVDSVAKTGALTLTGPSTGVWIFLVNGALTGTGFDVTMANGGQACNVWWAPDTAVTMTNSNLEGNILAGNADSGSITLTDSTLEGRALADLVVTTTRTVVTRPVARKGCPK
jgi:Ice-binding-like